MARIHSALFLVCVTLCALAAPQTGRAQTLTDLGAANAARNEMQGRAGRAAGDAANANGVAAEGAAGEGDAVAEGDQPAGATGPSGPWPDYDLNPSGQGDAHTMQRGSGPYLSNVKLVLVTLLFLLWVGSTDWINRDCMDLRRNYALWNSVAFGAFFVTFWLFLLIPYFFLGYLLLLIAYVAPLATYIVLRNREVDATQQVLTPGHIRFWLAQKLSKLGIKISAEKQLAQDAGAPVEFTSLVSTDTTVNAGNLLVARQMPGFVPAKNLIANMIESRAESAVLDYTPSAVSVKYLIDGVWINREPQEREKADPALAVLKTLLGLKPLERRARQEGTFQAKLEKTTMKYKFTSQATEIGERMILLGEVKDLPGKTLEEIGMRDKIKDKFLELFEQPGLILFTAPPAGGLSTLTDVALDETDRLLRTFVAVEPVNNRAREILNIDVTTFDPAKKETPATVLPKMIRKYPDVIVIRDLSDPETVKILCEQVGENRTTVGSIRSRDAAEALLRVLMLKVPAPEFAKAVSCVVNVRLLRKLCDKCKVGYAPSAQMLQKLGIPAGRVTQFFREPNPTEREQQKEKVCTACQNIGYLGRTGIFELLVVDPKIRAALVSEPKIDVIRKYSREAGNHGLQEEGVLLVAKGVTSYNELVRVLTPPKQA